MTALKLQTNWCHSLLPDLTPRSLCFVYLCNFDTVNRTNEDNIVLFQSLRLFLVFVDMMGKERLYVLAYSLWICQWSWSPLVNPVKKPLVMSEQVGLWRVAQDGHCTFTPSRVFHLGHCCLSCTCNAAAAGLLTVKCLPVQKLFILSRMP